MPRKATVGHIEVGYCRCAGCRREHEADRKPKPVGVVRAGGRREVGTVLPLPGGLAGVDDRAGVDDGKVEAIPGKNPAQIPVVDKEFDFGS